MITIDKQCNYQSEKSGMKERDKDVEELNTMLPFEQPR